MRPCSSASCRGQAILPISIIGRTSETVPKVGREPWQMTVQAMAVGGQGVPSQPGQCSQGSEAVMCVGAAFPGGAEANATVGNPAAKAAKQPSTAERIRRRTIDSTCIESRTSPITSSAIGEANIPRHSSSAQRWTYICAVPVTLKPLRHKDYYETLQTPDEHLKKRCKELGLLQRKRWGRPSPSRQRPSLPSSGYLVGSPVGVTRSPDRHGRGPNSEC